MAVTSSSGDFNSGSTATDQIQDVNGFPPPTLVDFETVAGGSLLGAATVHFDLTSIPLPNGGAGSGNCASNAANNSCSIPDFPFTFTENSDATVVSISFMALLNAYTGTSASGTTAYTATFT